MDSIRRQHIREKLNEQKLNNIINKVERVGYWVMGLGVAYYLGHYLAYVIR